MRITVVTDRGRLTAKRVLHAALLAVVFCTTAGCNYISCGSYYTYVNDEDDARAIVAWADAHVLGRSSATFRVNGGLLVGPGDTRIRGHAPLPPDLAGSEIRVVQEDANGISAIFIGRRSLKGLMVTRNTMPGALTGIRYPGASYLERGGRTAVMCYHQR
ncbi:hypothetical protein D3C75_783410 [compost metagenome]